MVRGEGTIWGSKAVWGWTCYDEGETVLSV